MHIKERKTHDYTRVYWGHNYNVVSQSDGGYTLHLAGWGEGLEAGHGLLIKQGGSMLLYQIDSIDYFRDPPDMWSATVSFVGRQ